MPLERDMAELAMAALMGREPRMEESAVDSPLLPRTEAGAQLHFRVFGLTIGAAQQAKIMQSVDALIIEAEAEAAAGLAEADRRIAELEDEIAVLKGERSMFDSKPGRRLRGVHP